MNEQTIFAPATAAGKAGVAVFRISGQAAKTVIEALCVPNLVPAPRQASLRLLRDHKGEPLDRVLVLYFTAPHSFTGEDVVELHTHGGRAIAQATGDALLALPGFRLAEAGEFTRRAFEHGRLDLTEAEAVADLVHAETEAQRKQALRQLDGALGRLYEGWRTRLARGLAYMEAAIDFSDEDLPRDQIDRQAAALAALRDEIAAHLNDSHRGERIRDGFSIAILGPPNAGKSSLLNALARRDAAIVSPVAGTTRDIVEVALDIGGYAVTLADTAGLREAADTTDAVEAEGIARARRRAGQADVKLLVYDGALWPARDAATQALTDDSAIAVVNKSDLIADRAGEALFIAARDGAGLDTLIAAIAQKLGQLAGAHAAPPLTRARHRTALTDCVAHLDRALGAAMPDMRAEDVRLAMRALGKITGRVDVEDLLDIIFRDFCIGK